MYIWFTESLNTQLKKLNYEQQRMFWHWNNRFGANWRNCIGNILGIGIRNGFVGSEQNVNEKWAKCRNRLPKKEQTLFLI